MSKISLKNKLIYILLVVVFFPHIIVADTVESEVVTISARVIDPNSNNGGGGGGSGGVVVSLPIIVNFSGISASPFSKIYLLKDGQIIKTTIADQNSNFFISISDLTANIYSFSIYSEDINNKISSLFSITLATTSGTTFNIGNIVLLNTPEIINPKIIDDNKKTCLMLKKGDLNCDNYINLTDFSIMIYWYGKMNPPVKIDLNNDHSVTLTDFSIMAFNWTG